MTLPPGAAMTDTVRLVSRIIINGKLEDVWREITKAETLQLKFFGAQMRNRALSAGSPVQMRTPDATYTSVVGEILEVSPPHRFSHTMKFTAHDDPFCKVTHDLKDVEGKWSSRSHRRTYQRAQRRRRT